MNRRRWLFVPLVYTVLTRLKNLRGVLDHLTRDVAIPLIPALVVFGADGPTALLLWLGFAALYEVGYLVNDQAPTASETGGDRLEGARVPWLPAVGCRLLVWAAVVVWALLTVGWWVATIYVVVCAGVILLSLLHTFLSSRTITVRYFSFALLSLSKYAPFLVPLIGWEHVIPYLGSIYLMYGFPRTAHYVVRKVSAAWTAEEVQRIQLMSHGLGLVPALVIVTPDLAAVSDRGWSGPALLWTFYAAAWAAALIARRLRRLS